MARSTLETTTDRVPMRHARKVALAAGVLYLITFASSIPAMFTFIDPVLANADFMTRPGVDNALLWGNFLDIVNALAAVGTAVVLFPVVKRQSETAALGFVASRLMEAAIIFVGVISLLTVVSLRQDLAGAAGADTASLVTTGHALAAIHDWVFLLGPNLMAAINAALLGFVMYGSRLVPRAIPSLGFVGAVTLGASVVALFFGIHELTSPTHRLLAAPIFFWELSLGLYMTFKGFKPAPIIAEPRGAAPRASEPAHVA